MFSFTNAFRRLRKSGLALLSLDERFTETKILAAKMLIRAIHREGLLENIASAEFKVFSQNGEDGILQYLINQTQIAAHERTFVEFGVENYEELNTRFLLMNDNWRGYVIDGSDKNVSDIKANNQFWRFELTAKQAFITRENINAVLAEADFGDAMGVLSIDIDGNDYWVWDSIVSASPVIVIVEYNSLWGADRAVSTPYDPAFARTRAHYSNLYWGASLKALEHLGARKGYALVGSNSTGNNAFFVRKDRLTDQKALTAEKAHIVSRYRESRNQRGQLTLLSGPERLPIIREMPLVDVETGILIKVGDLID